MQGTFATQLYIDSQQTIINDLKDTFSCKTSNQSTNILKINTSTYSVARTANHISQRLQDACRRLQNIQTSVHKSKSRNKEGKCEIRTQENTGVNFRRTGMRQQTCQQNSSVTKIEREIINGNSQRELMEIIRKMSAELKQNQNKIDELEDRFVRKQRELLAIQQKYLRQQKSLILEINRLKSLLKEKIDNQNKYFNQKIELDRIIDQNKVKVWELESQLKEIIQKYSRWSEKEVVIAQTVDRYYAKLQRDELTMKGLNKRGKEDKQILKILKIILQEEPSPEEDKENNEQLSNRGNCYHSVEKTLTEQIGAFSYRSYTSHKNIQKQKNVNYKTLEKLTSLQQVGDGTNSELYHLLMMQAATLQQFIT